MAEERKNNGENVKNPEENVTKKRRKKYTAKQTAKYYGKKFLRSVTHGIPYFVAGAGTMAGLVIAVIKGKENYIPYDQEDVIDGEAVEVYDDQEHEEETE